MMITAVLFSSAIFISGCDLFNLNTTLAVAAVKHFTEITGVRSVVFDKKVKQMKVTTTDNKIYWVSDKTRKVVTVHGEMIAKTLNPQALPLLKEAAIKRANDYVSLIYDDFENLTPGYTFPLSDGRYELHWLMTDKNNAILPGEVSIIIDSDTGRLYNYRYYLQPYSISTIPKITRDQAINIADNLLGETYRQKEVINCRLFVEMPDREQLNWKIEYKGGGFITIDALTGKQIKPLMQNVTF